MLIRRLQFMKEDYKEDLTIYQQQLSQVPQSLAPSFQNPRYTHARDPNERNKKLLKKVSHVISSYLTHFGKSYVHLLFLLQKFFSIGAPTNSGARGPPMAKSGPAHGTGTNIVWSRFLRTGKYMNQIRIEKLLIFNTFYHPDCQYLSKDHSGENIPWV